MTWTEFQSQIQQHQDPVLLLEGRRAIPPGEALQAVRLGKWLAQQLPNARFRSGNAEGSDAAFTEGVAWVDAGRLEIVTPYPGHRKKAHLAAASYTSPADMDGLHEPEILARSIQATPENRRLIQQYGKPGRSGAKAAYLVRDTLKVTGIRDRLTPPLAALFWVDLTDPEAGGTGHTIRVCRQLGIPVILQNHWLHWLPAPEPVTYPRSTQKGQ